MNDDLYKSFSYIPGTVSTVPELLSRYLPPIPHGVITTWLKRNIPPGSWILDPFAASPLIPIEAAVSGYRILVTANNPISRFLIEISANPPTTNDLKSALAELASSYKADERIEPHIRSLYDTRCARCSRIISADAFLWEQGNPNPTSRIYTCPYCGDTGEHSCTAFDVDRTRQFSSSGMHKARALERVVSLTDQDRIHVEQALSVYPPRALYSLITIVNKFEGLNISPDQKKSLTALLLYAFDQTNTMWRVPTTHERRRQLTIPKHYRENNTWVSLEQGIELLSNKISTIPPGINIPVTYWPNDPPDDGGICIYEGRLASIVNLLPQKNIKSVCTVIPRPNQAFWTLSALWAGWLWGRDAISSFKSVLHRQRYDWAWHTSALASVFTLLNDFLEPSTGIFGLIGESEPGYVASTLISAAYSGSLLDGMAIRSEDNQAQIQWRSRKHFKPLQQIDISEEEVGNIAKKYLETRGEPASYSHTITSQLISIIDAWTSAGFIQTTKSTESELSSTGHPTEKADQLQLTPSAMYTRIFNYARDSLSYRFGLLRFSLQNISSIEPAVKNEPTQTTMFLQDLNTFIEGDEDNLDYDLTIEELETSSDKERANRSTDVSESVLVWLRNTDKIRGKSLSDRIELSILNYLSTHNSVTIDEVDIFLCDTYQGLLTPDPEYISLCIESYGMKENPESISWYLRPEDKTSDRLLDLENIHQYINQIGNRIGINSKYDQNDKTSSVLWEDSTHEYDYCFFPTTTANIGEIFTTNQKLLEKAFVVLPGSRANIIIYKLRRDPRLYRAFDSTIGNWRFLKFRHLKSIAENPTLSRENLEQLLKLDPLTYTTPQLRLI